MRIAAKLRGGCVALVCLLSLAPTAVVAERADWAYVNEAWGGVVITTPRLDAKTIR